VTQVKFTTKTTFNEVLESVRDIAISTAKSTFAAKTKISYEFHTTNIAMIYISDIQTERRLAFIRIEDGYREKNPDKFDNREFTIKGAGIRTFLEAVTKELMPRTLEKTLPRVTWYYSSGGRMTYKPILLQEPKPALDEFYPFINCGIKEYYQKFLESDAPIALFLGPPGTGKTSFIRNLIYQHNLNTAFTYDEALMHSDSFFVNYLTDDDLNMLVVEDSEQFLVDREDAGNKVMAKLLNVSDGLVKVFDKKIIFTANITDVEKVDSALIRKGRCFDVINFRALSYSESVKACKAIDMDLPEQEKDYTLAELFNRNEGSVRNVAKVEKVKFGFGI